MQHSEEDLRAFIGPNADYYLQAWPAVDPGGGLQPLRWNWPAFFLNVLWLLYRRMYKYFWITLGVLAVMGAIEGFIEGLMGVTAPRWLDAAINVVIASFFGTFGTWFYYRHAMITISQTKAHQAGPEALGRAGGVRLLWPLLLLGVAVALGILVAIFLPHLAQ